MPTRERNLFVANLPLDVGEADLIAAFCPFGPVTSVRVTRGDRGRGEARAHGFVNFSNEEHANAAMQNMHGSLIHGQRIFVSVAQCARRTPSDTPPSQQHHHHHHHQQQQRPHTPHGSIGAAAVAIGPAGFTNFQPGQPTLPQPYYQFPIHHHHHQQDATTAAAAPGAGEPFHGPMAAQPFPQGASVYSHTPARPPLAIPSFMTLLPSSAPPLPPTEPRCVTLPVMQPLPPHFATAMAGGKAQNSVPNLRTPPADV